MAPFRIQYVGNLFVDRLFDHFSKLAVANRAPRLALLGNIGHPSSPRTAEFLEYCTRTWKTVYWVPGPYELGTRFFGSVVASGTFHDNLERMAELSRKKGVRMVHQSEYMDNDVRVVGTTLWTPCEQGRIAEKYSQEEFCTILKKPGEPITPIDIAGMNEEDVDWVRQQLIDTKYPTVVLTHHLPHPSLLSTAASLHTLKRVGLEVNNLTYLFQPHVRLWLAGSSGSSGVTTFRTGTTTAVNSLYEYPLRTRHAKNPGFNAAEVAEIGAYEQFPFHATLFYGPRFPSPQLT